ncbi:MAG: sugar ABC transporter permease [Candidatus Marinimicrobia bacterium]|nr:sugar ABC transporter permease [Candidatus Neomarinimicrobiota bacterium]MCH7763219.1 sugar ABC transporter permease [Candidatus Neomarinimicrobiota bacterium]
MKFPAVINIGGEQRAGHMLVAPYYIFFAMFLAYPLIFSFVLVFHRWSIVGPLEWVGLSNIFELGGDPLFWKSIGNTLIFLIIHVPLQVGFALVLAAILNSKIPAQGVFRAAFFLPVVVSGVAVTILWKQMFSTNLGILNQVLYEFGIDPVPWVTDPSWAMPSIAMMATWKNIGLYVVLFLAGLQGIPKHLYDAADIDGASTVQKFFHITIPAINPVFMVVLILSTLGGFSLFIEPYVITGGGPMNSTLSGVLYIYRQAFSFFRMGYAATIGFALAIIVMGVIIIQRRFVEREV